jgi:hypothetical protein
MATDPARPPVARCPVCRGEVQDDLVVQHFNERSRRTVLVELWRGADTGGRVILAVLVALLLAPVLALTLLPLIIAQLD